MRAHRDVRGFHAAITPGQRVQEAYEGRCKATWKGKFKLPWREVGLPKHHDGLNPLYLLLEKSIDKIGCP